MYVSFSSNLMRHSCKRCGREFSGDKDRVFCSRECARLFGYELLRGKRFRRLGSAKVLPDREIISSSSIATNTSNP